MGASTWVQLVELGALTLGALTVGALTVGASTWVRRLGCAKLGCVDEVDKLEFDSCRSNFQFRLPGNNLKECVAHNIYMNLPRNKQAVFN